MKTPSSCEQRIVYLIEDDEITANAYRSALSPLAEVHNYQLASQFLNDVPSDPDRACLVVDIQLKNESGLDLLRQIRQRGWTVPAIVVSGTVTVPTAMNAVENGVFRVIEKPVPYQVLLTVVKEALESRRVRRKLNRVLLSEALEKLSDVERHVLSMMLDGAMNKVIALRLDISLRSVVRHRKRILQTMGTTDHAELIREWALAGLESPEIRTVPPPPHFGSKDVQHRLHDLANELRTSVADGQLEAHAGNIANQIDQLADRD